MIGKKYIRSSLPSGLFAELKDGKVDHPIIANKFAGEDRQQFNFRLPAESAKRGKISVKNENIFLSSFEPDVGDNIQGTGAASKYYIEYVGDFVKIYVKDETGVPLYWTLSDDVAGTEIALTPEVVRSGPTSANQLWTLVQV
ncbi:hypothetical protein MD484_g6474, partial [Candolleomyces efflorescens]